MSETLGNDERLSENLKVVSSILEGYLDMPEMVYPQSATWNGYSVRMDLNILAYAGNKTLRGTVEIKSGEHRLSLRVDLHVPQDAPNQLASDMDFSLYDRSRQRGSMGMAWFKRTKDDPTWSRAFNVPVTPDFNETAISMLGDFPNMVGDGAKRTFSTIKDLKY